MRVSGRYATSCVKNLDRRFQTIQSFVKTVQIPISLPSTIWKHLLTSMRRAILNFVKLMNRKVVTVQLQTLYKPLAVQQPLHLFSFLEFTIPHKTESQDTDTQNFSDSSSDDLVLFEISETSSKC